MTPFICYSFFILFSYILLFLISLISSLIFRAYSFFIFLSSSVFCQFYDFTLFSYFLASAYSFRFWKFYFLMRYYSSFRRFVSSFFLAFFSLFDNSFVSCSYSESSPYFIAWGISSVLDVVCVLASLGWLSLFCSFSYFCLWACSYCIFLRSSSSR